MGHDLARGRTGCAPRQLGPPPRSPPPPRRYTVDQRAGGAARTPVASTLRAIRLDADRLTDRPTDPARPAPPCEGGESSRGPNGLYTALYEYIPMAPIRDRPMDRPCPGPVLYSDAAWFRPTRGVVLVEEKEVISMVTISCVQCGPVTPEYWPCMKQNHWRSRTMQQLAQRPGPA